MTDAKGRKLRHLVQLMSNILDDVFTGPGHVVIPVVLPEAVRARLQEKARVQGVPGASVSLLAAAILDRESTGD